MIASRQMVTLALALCLCHASAFAGVISARGSISQGGLQQMDQRLANAAVPRCLDGGDLLGVVRRTRGGQIWNRKSVSVPQETVSIEAPAPSPEKKKGLLAAYLRALDESPLPTKVATSGVICGVGDIMAQALAFKSAKPGPFALGAFVRGLQLQRFAIYGVLGALWIAPVVHYWFDALEEVTKTKAGPPKTFAGRMGKALRMVTLDQLIGAPLVNAGFMFLFAFATAICTGVQGVPALKSAGSMVRTNIWSTLLVCWKLWPVANLLNFAFVPANLRVLFMNFVGLGWNIYLSAAVN